MSQVRPKKNKTTNNVSYRLHNKFFLKKVTYHTASPHLLARRYSKSGIIDIKICHFIAEVVRRTLA
jgi:hypothetical protein